MRDKTTFAQTKAPKSAATPTNLIPSDIGVLVKPAVVIPQHQFRSVFFVIHQ